MFSSAVRYVPHGVSPPAQLPNVPSARTPSGSSCVRINAAPRAGPPMSIGVSAVMRRLKRESFTSCQRPRSRAISIDRHALRGLRHGDDLRMLAARKLAPVASHRTDEAGMPRNISSSSRVLVVDAQNAALAARVEREEMNGVAVLAELTLLPLGGARLEQHAVGKLAPRRDREPTTTDSRPSARPRRRCNRAAATTASALLPCIGLNDSALAGRAVAHAPSRVPPATASGASVAPAASTRRRVSRWERRCAKGVASGVLFMGGARSS